MKFKLRHKAKQTLTIAFNLLLLFSFVRASADENKISIMAYNVENLFDTIHDSGKSDESFLPIDQKQSPEHKELCNKVRNQTYKKECLNLDWNDQVLNSKLANLASVIGNAGANGPDVLILEEVENNRVLSMLNKFLAQFGYTTQVLLEGPDQRGIDQAVLSRLPLMAEPRLHQVPFQNLPNPEDQERAASMRGILEVNLKLPDGQMLTVFGSHFSSQQNPRVWRENYVAFAKAIFSQRKNEFIILGGDLNITAKEESEAGFFSNELSPLALISHFVGCQSCEGTHFYQNKWSFLDVLLFSKNFSEGSSWNLDPSSIQVIKTSTNQTNKGTPLRFNSLNGTGVSDHFPIFAQIVK